MHAASKTATAFLKATNTETISHGIPEDDMTAAAVETPPLLLDQALSNPVGAGGSQCHKSTSELVDTL